MCFSLVAKGASKEEESQKTDEELLSKYYTEYKKKLLPESSNDASNSIPRFYFKVFILLTVY